MPTCGKPWAKLLVPVQRVYQPDGRAGGLPGVPAALFGQDAVVGEGGAQAPHNVPLHRDVRLGDGVDVPP
jgi:hypothetical protein